MARTIESPGVQITEVDLSLNPVLPTGTNVLVAGFAPQGPTDEVLQVSSLSEFQQIFGTPQTPAERYFYYTAAPLFNTPANINIYRLPYGDSTGTGFGAYYGALVYPAVPVSIDHANNDATFGTTLNTFNAQASGVMYMVGQPTHFELTQAQYDSILQGNGFSWSNIPSSSFASISDMQGAAIIVLNKGQTTVNEKFEGYYTGLIDNVNINPATNFTDILNVKSVSFSAASTTNYTVLPTTRLNFNLSSLSDNQTYGTVTYGNQGGSVSQVLEDSSTFNLQSTLWDDTLTFGLFKLRQSVFAADTIKLDYVFSEKYVGTLDYWRQINSSNGGAPINFSLATADGQSPNVQILVNDYISNKNGTSWLDVNGVPTKKVRMLNSSYSSGTSMYTLFTTASTHFSITNQSEVYALTGALNNAYTLLGGADSLFPLGSYANGNLQNKNLGSIPAKLDRMFSVTENAEQYDIDLTVDGGLSTIFAVTQDQGTTTYNDAITVSSVNGLAVPSISQVTGSAATFSQNYQTIINRFSDFAGLKRKDHLFIGDLPRHIFVQGANFKILDNPANNFSLNLYSPLRNVTSTFNTSYMTLYGNWIKVFDINLDDFCWVPFSGTAASSMANMDANFQPWFAPAGFTRGIVNGATDIAIYPNQKQRDQLYKISINPVTFFPNEGFVIYGQKTSLKQPSAFDRINVRRLFLNLEKATNSTCKYFVFEQNTLLTRTRVVNTLKPIFENAKNTEGLYDYLIVCDERNNTPDVIDQNELVVDIYLKPVRTAEFILVNFYATRTSTNFNELV